MNFSYAERSTRIASAHSNPDRVVEHPYGPARPLRQIRSATRCSPICHRAPTYRFHLSAQPAMIAATRQPVKTTSILRIVTTLSHHRSGTRDDLEHAGGIPAFQRDSPTSGGQGVSSAGSARRCAGRERRANPHPTCIGKFRARYATTPSGSAKSDDAAGTGSLEQRWRPIVVQDIRGRCRFPRRFGMCAGVLTRARSSRSA